MRIGTMCIENQGQHQETIEADSVTAHCPRMVRINRLVGAVVAAQTPPGRIAGPLRTGLHNPAQQGHGGNGASEPRRYRNSNQNRMVTIRMVKLIRRLVAVIQPSLMRSSL